MGAYLVLLLGVVLGYFALVHKNANTSSVPPSAPFGELAQARQDAEAAIARADELELETQAIYLKLTADRNALDTTNKAAVSAFNMKAADYAKQNTRLEEQRKEVARLKKLEGLLETQALASSRKQEGRKQENRVVIYSTSRCPACKSAKQYLSQRNIPFNEFDVEHSREAAAEFKRLGGHGVPLIVINGEKMSGFNPTWVEERLKKNAPPGAPQESDRVW